MISVVILGSGNVASHLIHAFLKCKEIDLKQVYSRNLNTLTPFKKDVSITNKIELLKKAEITIMAINDDVISEISAKINNPLVVHTSGSVEMNALKNSGNKGVFYPLQTFSKNKDINLRSIPFCLEAQNKKDKLLLEKLTHLIHGKIYYLNSSQRKRIHVAAVFINNFTNHMYTLAYDICKEYGVPFTILYPLIKETSEKIENLIPEQAQTGPAKRNDEKTIKNHLNLLNENQRKLYLTITQSIQEHGKKL